MAAGYAVLIVVAALAFLLRLTGTATVEAFAHNPEVERIASPTPPEIVVSACGAVAGVVLVAAYRRSVIAGPLVVLIITPAAATIGVALVAGMAHLLREGFRHLLLDVLLILAMGTPVFAIERRTVHQYPPLV